MIKLDSPFQISASNSFPFPKNCKRKIPTCKAHLDTFWCAAYLRSPCARHQLWQQNSPALPGGLLPPTRLPAAPWAAPRAG